MYICSYTKYTNNKLVLNKKIGIQNIFIDKLFIISLMHFEQFLYF